MTYLDHILHRVGPSRAIIVDPVTGRPVATVPFQRPESETRRTDAAPGAPGDGYRLAMAERDAQALLRGAQ